MLYPDSPAVLSVLSSYGVRSFNSVMLYLECSITLRSLALILPFIHITLPLYLPFLRWTSIWNGLIPPESQRFLFCGETALSIVWSVVHRLLELCLVSHMASQVSQWSISSSRVSYNFYKRVREVYFRKDSGPNSEQEPNYFNGQFECWVCF